MDMMLLLLLLAGHALADFPLQGDWLSKAKNRKLAPIKGEIIWPLALLSHALIHGLMVYIITMSFFLALVEVLSHCVIDWLKCEEKISYNLDQILHMSMKVVYILYLGLFFKHPI